MQGFRDDPDCPDGHLIDENVTSRAHEFLFEHVTLRNEVTLGDVFALMEASPLLQQFYRRDFAHELCEEARKGPINESQGVAVEHEGIAFLELYQQWGLDTSTNEYSGTQHLPLHGLGHELAEDMPEQGCRRGERIAWSLSLTPLRQLLNLPIRINAEVRITEDDVDAKAHGHEIQRARNPGVSLGQVIHGLLWELSFHGGPQEQLELSDSLKRQVAEIDAGTAETVSADDVFEPFDRPGCDALFDDLGGRSTREIVRAIHDIDDEANAALTIDNEFNGMVVVKAQFRDRTGREFRKAFRAAGR